VLHSRQTLVAIVICLLLGAVCQAQGIKVKDMTGRQVELSAPASRIVAIGPGALRLCAYFKDPSLIVGIEQFDIDSSIGRPYLIANPAYANLPVIGPGGPNNGPDPEQLLLVRPGVIFSTYGSDRAFTDNLQGKTRIPVVALSYGETGVFDPAVYDSIRIIGQVIGREEKAEEIVAYMERCRLDLHARTKDIPDSHRPKVYVGGVNMKGAHGIESTQGDYPLFNAVNARNVVDELGRRGALMVDKEKLIQWNPDIIFIDEGGLELVRQDYQKNKPFYQVLGAVKKGQIYGQLPYNYYTTNIDTAIANAYYIGKVLYPDHFADIDPVAKANEIYEFLVGQGVYVQMAADYGGYMALNLE